MSITYIDSLGDKNILPNVVILFKGEYWSIRQPDSGLVVDADKVGVLTSFTVNPTTVDPYRASTTINNYSFKLLDKAFVVSALFNGESAFFQGEPIDIWIGRCQKSPTDEPMPFANYYKMPRTFVNKCTKQDSAYTFQAVEARDRIANGAFNKETKLAVDILDITTVISVQDASVLPTSGTIKIENEFISYTGVIGNDLQNCVRGEESTVAVAHDAGQTVSLYSIVQANPIDILLRLLISSGGGGPYDVLPDGAGIDQTLVDDTQMQAVKSEFFSTYTFRLAIGEITDFKKFIEDELLFPLGIRLRANNNGKIGLALLDRNIFEIDTPAINHDNLLKNPDFTVDDTKIVNKVRIEWDYDAGTQQFKQVTESSDAPSIAQFGEKATFKMAFKGIKASLSGAAIVNDIAFLFLSRFAFPRPQISASTQMSASYLLVGDKTDLFTTTIPNEDGQLNYASTLEVLSSAINFATGDCKFQLSYTSFSGVRSCYIAPSDTINTVTNQKTVVIGAGRGANYRKGWKLRLYDNNSRDHASTQVNEIFSVVGDTITFVDDWSTTLVASQHRIMFADYDQVTDQQKKFCFISDDGNNFADGLKSYQVSFG